MKNLRGTPLALVLGLVSAGASSVRTAHAAGPYTLYVTVSGAGNHDGKTLANAMTLAEARQAAAAGDVVFVQKGLYQLPQLTTSFSKSGTAQNPIIWEGEISDADLSWEASKGKPTLSSNGANSTVLASAIDANYQIRINGDYQVFRNFVFQEDAQGRGLVQVDGNFVTVETSASKYPSNVSSSSNHTWMVYGHDVTFRKSSFYNGSRTILWVRKSGAGTADNFLMEQCKLTGASNHPPIQIMPTTNSSSAETIKHPIVRRNVFIDNPYGDGIYSRQNEQGAFYNNLFIRSSTPYSVDVHTGINAVCDTKGSFVAYNTIVESGGNIIFNRAGNQVYFYNNLVYLTAAPTGIPYRYTDPFNATTGHKNDYNLWFSAVGNIGDMSCDLGSQPTAKLSGIFAAYGFEEHSQIQVAPEFTNAAADDYSPMAATSKQVGAGIPISKTNGFWMDVKDDFYGNLRDAQKPTVGAIEYGSVPAGGAGGAGGNAGAGAAGSAGTAGGSAGGPGSGGSAAGGASAGAAGNGASAGTAGAGATSSGSGGSAAKSSEDDGGCGCRTSQRAPTLPASALLLLGALGWIARRRQI